MTVRPTHGLRRALHSSEAVLDRCSDNVVQSKPLQCGVGKSTNGNLGVFVQTDAKPEYGDCSFRNCKEVAIRRWNVLSNVRVTESETLASLYVYLLLTLLRVLGQPLLGGFRFSAPSKLHILDHIC